MNYLKAQTKANKPVTPSTGKVTKSDDNTVTISIDYLKDANAKMLERLYYIKVNKEQASVIKLNKEYIAEQEDIIKDFQGRVVTLTDQVNNSNIILNKEKNKRRFLSGVTVVSVLGVAAAIFIK